METLSFSNAVDHRKSNSQLFPVLHEGQTHFGTVDVHLGISFLEAEQTAIGFP